MSKLLKNVFWLLALASPLFITSCSDDSGDGDDTPTPTAKLITISPGASAADDAQSAFIQVQPEYTIYFEAGTFDFTNTLSMDGKSTVVIKGAGRDKTILDFSGQLAGGDGVLVTNSNSIRFEDLTIRDAKGDALKTRDCNKVSFVNVGTVWSGTPSEDNGAYGLYPVLCTEVYIDGCYAYGASDAGIYVGQSDKVIVKNCVAESNVAGIEIENTTNADVFDNEAFDNTGGILIFDLPDLTQYGSNVRVFNNNSHDNNHRNFAPEGNIVSNVPIGTGVMVLSTKDVEIFDNQINDNNFSGVLIANYLFVADPPADPNFNPFPNGINIHDNTLSLNSSAVNVVDQNSTIQQIIGLLSILQLGQPDILTDGLILAPDDICINQPNASFVNMNASDTTFASVTNDVAPHICSPASLPAVEFDPF